MEAAWTPRGGGAPRTLAAGSVVNSTGPERDVARLRHPLLAALLVRGLARGDRLKLGLDVTDDGHLVGTDGRVSERLLALGPLTIPAFWEILAVPDLRRQVAEAAGRLLANPAAQP